MAENTQALTHPSQNQVVAPALSRPNLLQTVLAWPLSRKLALVAVAAVSAALFGVIIQQARVAEYQLLFAGLTGSDGSAVVEWLKERKIPYRVTAGGGSIEVPADKVYEARLSLAGSGLPSGGGVGFEIFDKQSFGMTDFAQKVNYRRALQGELARTIASLGPVESARVHLALPEKRLFREQQQEATASVIIKLSQGGALKDSQVQGIVHLVSGSVEGMEPENVTVVDAAGRVLTETRRAESLGPMTPGMLDYQQALERRLEQRGQSLLDRAVGVGNGLVRVTAAIDFAQRERVQESYDPNAAAVRSESTVSENSSSEAAGGVPGVQANLNEGATVGAGPSSNRTEETASYEISKTISKQVDSVGTVQSLSVSVLVAERALPPATAGEAPRSEPRSEKELKEIEQMVRSALGIDPKRGDQLTVVSMPFESGFELEPMVKASPADHINSWLPLLRYLLLALAAFLAYRFLLKPTLRTLQGQRRQDQQVYEQYRTVAEMEAQLQGGGNLPLLAAPDDFVSQLRREISRTASSPSQVIKSWMNEG